MSLRLLFTWYCIYSMGSSFFTCRLIGLLAYPLYYHCVITINYYCRASCGSTDMLFNSQATRHTSTAANILPSVTASQIPPSSDHLLDVSCHSHSSHSNRNSEGSLEAVLKIYTQHRQPQPLTTQDALASVAPLVSYASCRDRQTTPNVIAQCPGKENLTWGAPPISLGWEQVLDELMSFSWQVATAVVAAIAPSLLPTTSAQPPYILEPSREHRLEGQLEHRAYFGI